MEPMRIYREELERELEMTRLETQNKILKFICATLIGGYLIWIMID
jgi:hypothetical protein